MAMIDDHVLVGAVRNRNDRRRNEQYCRSIAREPLISDSLRFRLPPTPILGNPPE